MPHDLVNRDPGLERRFLEASKHTSQEKPHMRMLYDLWLDMRSLDLQLARNKRLRTIQAGLYFAGELFDVMPKDEQVYYDYMKWFYFNRIINTGTRGHAICELNPIFVRPKKKYEKPPSNRE